MKKTRISDIFEKLWQELQRAEDVNIEAREKMEALRRDVDRCEGGDEPDFDSLRDRVRELETQFAVEHPTLARIARDMADAIAKMGI